MPKKGQQQPWRLVYEWSNGAKGVVACYNEDEAKTKESDMRRYEGIRTDGATVTTSIERRA